MRKRHAAYAILAAAVAAALIDNRVQLTRPGMAQSSDELSSLGKQVEHLYEAGRYLEAAPSAERYVALVRERYGGEHSEVATALDHLAQIYRVLGRIAEAETLYRESLAIREKTLGPDHLEVGVSLNYLGVLYYAQARYAEAEVLIRRGLVIREKVLGPDHADVGESVGNLAMIHQVQGHYAEAEALHKRALDITEKVFGPEHSALGMWLNNLAELYRLQGRYADAEPLIKRALAITERALGPDHPDVGFRLNNLAVLYHQQGRFSEAEPLYKRALAIAERAQGAEHADVGRWLNNLAELYRAQGRYDELEQLVKKALKLRENALGPDHPDVGVSVSNLALLYHNQKRFAEAEALHRRAISIFEKALGSDHPDVALPLNNLAATLDSQGRYAEAEALYQRSLAIRRRALGEDHPDVGQSLNNLGWLNFVQRDWAAATAYWQQSTDLLIRRSKRGTETIGAARVGKGKSEADRENYQFRNLTKAMYRLAAAERAQEPHWTRDTFGITQWAQSSEAGASLAQMSARLAKGDGALALLVRERQDLVGQWQTRDKALVAARSQPPEKRDAKGEVGLSNSLAAIDKRISEIDRTLEKGFPDYAALASPAPLDMSGAQVLLRDEEALVLFLDTEALQPTREETFIWAVTKTDARWERSSLGSSALRDKVAALRRALDPGASGARAAVSLATTDAEARYFDLGLAHELYDALFGKIEDLIKGKHLLIVPSGPLTSLPFQVLVTSRPAQRGASAAPDFRSAQWLIRRHALSVLPTAGSLKAIRQNAKVSRAGKPYLGIGNPLVEGPNGNDRRAFAIEGCQWHDQALPARVPEVERIQLGPRNVSEYFRGSLANVAEIRRLSPLPETATELCQIGRGLGGGEDSILLGSAATETAIKRLSAAGKLAEYRVLHFATHGLIAGEFGDLAEPALVLSPPETASEEDDGLLAASEVAGLKLDADWVILSACNTAAGDQSNAEALSGLARAFFYAGARALLVSHWPVNSGAAVELTTVAFQEMRKAEAAGVSMGRAEALRNAMLALIDTGSAREAHPTIWAPFVLVGEGGAGR